MAFSPTLPGSETTGPAVTPIPIRDIAPWAVLAASIALVLVYFVGFEEGALNLLSSNVVHEFVHDARHLAGLPCH